MELGYQIPASEERCLIANDSTKREKWPVSFWIILKILGMTDSKVVDDTRKCLKCRVRGLRVNKRDTFHNRIQLDNSNVTCHDNDETQPLLNQLNKNKECDVCDTLWWDFYGQTVKYNERGIGAKIWCHYGSGVMSSVMWSILLAINAYYLGLTVTQRGLIPSNFYILLINFHLLRVCHFFLSWCSVPDWRTILVYSGLELSTFVTLLNGHNMWTGSIQVFRGNHSSFFASSGPSFYTYRITHVSRAV
ncbi:hypothetical protein BSL78_10535 [Apostichopus japonicus]|uniref:Uncharacterized protein n=1 Tax=Stichopus japonicus TaxID=307972 RepID=A0A2G8KX53_STIJA|nr:hypothetical protein BSL78_10535 [Apostichopus japonicus]